MKMSSIVRLSKALASGAILFQMAGCDATGFTSNLLDILNTVFLGITAAGGVAILQNI